MSRKAAVPVRRCVMYILSSPPKYFSAHFGRVERNSEHAIKIILFEPMISPAYCRKKFGRLSLTGGKTHQTTIFRITSAIIAQLPMLLCFMVSPEFDAHSCK